MGAVCIGGRATIISDYTLDDEFILLYHMLICDRNASGLV